MRAIHHSLTGQLLKICGLSCKKMQLTIAIQARKAKDERNGKNGYGRLSKILI